MAEGANLSPEALRQLVSPTRNRYFYGKLLDVYHFNLEQTYLNRKRWLLNRLGLGAGVLCGLDLRLREEGGLLLQPGVAIDPYGREIVVPEVVEIPAELLVDDGFPDDDDLEARSWTICLEYLECDTEPVPVLVSDCDIREDCAASVIRERFRVTLREGLPERTPGSLTADECALIYPELPPEDFNRRITIDETLADACPAPEIGCVILGTATFEDGEWALDTRTYRTVTYSNAQLYDLLLCLAEKVDSCCQQQVRSLRYISGDGQSTAPSETLERPVVVQLIDGDGNPVPGETVVFRVLSAGGSVMPDADTDQVSVTTNDPDGQARVQWRLGNEPGLNTLEAVHQISGSRVTFFAIAQEPVRDLLLVSGDAQTAAPGSTLLQPVVMQVVDDAGNAVAGETVTMQVRGGGGSISPASVVADASGRAAFNWTLGANIGLNTAEARITNGVNVVAMAMGFRQGDEPTPTPDLPVITTVWPRNARVLSPNANDPDAVAELRSWVSEPRVELTFDRAMNENDLVRARQWLRVYQVIDVGEVIVSEVSVELNRIDQRDDGFMAIYTLNREEIEGRPSRFLVQIQARRMNITDLSSPPQLLDADFSGTALTGERLRQIWTIDEEFVYGTDPERSEVWNAFVDTGAVLPQSGNDSQGGVFHSWFEIMQ